MATYGVSYFGTDLYGAPRFVEFDVSPFEATATDYGELTLTWNHPTGDWTRLRLLRSAYGYPENAEDGTLLIEGENDSRTGFYDPNLTRGVFYYYSIFLYAEGAGWVRAGDAIGLTIDDHAQSESLFNFMPLHLQMIDEQFRTGVTAGPMARFLSTFGVALDHIKTEYDSLRWLRNPDKISGNLLRLLSEQFGLPNDPTLSMHQQRRWLRDAVALYQLKGTMPGIRAAATAVTGWAAEVGYSKNLLRGETSNAWYLFGAGLTDTLSPDDPSIRALLVTSGPGNSTWMIGSAPNDHMASATPVLLPWYGIPVTDGQPFTFQAQVRPQTAGNAGVSARFRVAYFDVNGARLSTANGTAVTTVANTWTSLSQTTTPPAAATHAAVYVQSTAGGGASAATFVRRLQYAQGSSVSEAEPARAVRISFVPARRNLVRNPSGEVGTGWVVSNSGGATSSWSPQTSDFQFGTQAFRGELTGVGSNGGYPRWQCSQTDPEFVAGEKYVASVWVKASPHTHSLRLYQGFATTRTVPFTGTGEWERLSLEGFVTSAATDPTRLSVYFVPAQTVGATIIADGVMIERADSVGTYFDGDFFGADWLWAGTPHNSVSNYFPGRTMRSLRVREILEDFLPIDQGVVIDFQS